MWATLQLNSTEFNWSFPQPLQLWASHVDTCPQGGVAARVGERPGFLPRPWVSVVCSGTKAKVAKNVHYVSAICGAYRHHSNTNFTVLDPAWSHDQNATFGLQIGWFPAIQRALFWSKVLACSCASRNVTLQVVTSPLGHVMRGIDWHWSWLIYAIELWKLSSLKKVLTKEGATF